MWLLRRLGLGGVQASEAALMNRNSSCRAMMYQSVMFLNKIIAATKQHIWVAAFPEKITFTPTGFLEEVPMYLPGSDQPFWILLRWGDPPPEKMVK
jgi:hypothetical protein